MNGEIFWNFQSFMIKREWCVKLKSYDIKNRCKLKHWHITLFDIFTISRLLHKICFLTRRSSFHFHFHRFSISHRRNCSFGQKLWGTSMAVTASPVWNPLKGGKEEGRHHPPTTTPPHTLIKVLLFTAMPYKRKTLSTSHQIYRTSGIGNTSKKVRIIPISS